MKPKYLAVAASCMTFTACSVNVNGPSISSSPALSQGPLSTPSEPPSSPRASAGGSDLPSGTYVDGGAGTPHYFITLTANANGTLTGTVSFLHQDGQTEATFTFSGTTQSGIATLNSSTGRLITASYSHQDLELGSCTTYLGYACRLFCQFASLWRMTV